MKIAVSTIGRDLDGEIDVRFGRAQGFLIFDTDSGETVFLENVQNLNAIQGAGIQAAENVISQGTHVVLTGHCGPKAFTTLQAAGVDVYSGITGTVTVREAIDKFRKGELNKANGADVVSHW